jgi:guanine deaminase
VRESEELIGRWHNKGRQHYAITVRFAPTSTHAQMKLAGELAAQYPDVSKPTWPKIRTK